MTQSRDIRSFFTANSNPTKRARVSESIVKEVPVKDSDVEENEIDENQVESKLQNLHLNARYLMHSSWFTILESEFKRPYFRTLVKYLQDEENKYEILVFKYLSSNRF